MLALVFVLVLNQATRIITNSLLAILILAYQSIVILALLGISLLVSKALHIPYEDHQAIALISVTKNQSVAAAMAVSAIGPQSAIAPALIPIIQPILVVAYLHADNICFFGCFFGSYQGCLLSVESDPLSTSSPCSLLLFFDGFP
jgi:ACR3 family arsenite efflux pump ArsB